MLILEQPSSPDRNLDELNSQFAGLVSIIVLMQYVALTGTTRIDEFAELDRAHKDNEISRVTARSINENQPSPVDVDRESALARLSVFQVRPLQDKRSVGIGAGRACGLGCGQNRSDAIRTRGGEDAAAERDCNFCQDLGGVLQLRILACIGCGKLSEDRTSSRVCDSMRSARSGRWSSTRPRCLEGAKH